jgi:hypothetical protein
MELLLRLTKCITEQWIFLLPMYKLVEYFDILVQLETCLHFFVKRTYKLSKLLMFQVWSAFYYFREKVSEQSNNVQ